MNKDKRELPIDELPRPGEPLTYAIHEDNQRLLDEELRERQERMKARLTDRELKQLKRRHAWLFKKLNRAKYNPLIQERWHVWEQFKAHGKAAQKVRGKRRDAFMTACRAAAERGRVLNAAIAKLQPWADEFETIVQRLAAHQAVLKYEAEDAANRAQFRREAKTWEQQIKATFRQSARLHHAGTDSKGNPFIRIPEIEHIIFKDDKVFYQVKLSEQGLFERLFNKWHSALPYNVDIADLTCKETLDNLSGTTNRVVTVERSKKGTSLFYVISRLDSPDGIPSKVLYNFTMQWYPTQDHDKTPWAAGVTDDRKATFYNFEDNPHILIAGTTQSGKSNHVNQMIATLATMNSPKEVQLLLIDNKGGIEFVHWAGLKHLLRPMVKSVDQVLGALKAVRGIMEYRLSVFESMKAKNLRSYNSKVTPDGKLPRIIIFVDEMATLMNRDETPDIQAELMVLASQGRAVGVHLVVCTQHATVDILPNWIKTNMSMRISGKMPSHTASQVVLDSIAAALLPNIAGRMVFSQGRFDVIAQSPYISDDEVSRAVKISKEFEAADDRELTGALVLVAPKPKFSREDLLDLVLNQLSGKLSASRVFDKIGNEVAPLRTVRSMVADITDEFDRDGCITHRDQQYSLRKDRNSYYMKLIERSSEPESDETPETPALLDCPVDELEVTNETPAA